MSGPLLASYIVLWVLVVVLATAVLALYNHFGRMYLVGREGRARQGPELDREFPALTVEDVIGRTVRVPAIDTPTLLVFMSTTCAACADLIADLAELSRQRADLAVLVVCAGTTEDVRDWANVAAGVLPVAADPGARIALNHRVVMTPFAIAIDTDGLVRAKGVVAGGDGLRAFLSPISIATHAGRPTGETEVNHEAVPRVEHASSL